MGYTPYVIKDMGKYNPEFVKSEYENDSNASLSDIADKYGIVEINVVNSDGIILKSTEDLPMRDSNPRQGKPCLRHMSPLALRFAQTARG